MIHLRVAVLVAAAASLTVHLYAQQASPAAGQQPAPQASAAQQPAPAANAPATAAASKCPAPTPPATLSPYTFSGTTGILLYQVPTAKVTDFETFLGHLRDALAKSSDPKAKGWRIYRDSTLGPNNDVVYVFLLDPAIPCVDYSLGPIMASAISDQAELKRVWSLYSASLRTPPTLMDLLPPGQPAAKGETPKPASAQVPAAPPGPAVPLDANPTRTPK
jgi:hypothetical protein